MARTSCRSILLDHINAGHTFIRDKEFPKHGIAIVYKDGRRSWLSDGLKKALRKLIVEGIVVDNFPLTND